MAIPSSATAEQALGFAAEGWHFAVERSGFRVLAAVFRAESSIVGTQPPDIGTVHSAGSGIYYQCYYNISTETIRE